MENDKRAQYNASEMQIEKFEQQLDRETDRLAPQSEMVPTRVQQSASSQRADMGAKEKVNEEKSV